MLYSVILMALVPVIIRLGPFSYVYGGLNHHNVGDSGGLDIEHLVKLNIGARHAGRRRQLPEAMIFLRT